MSGSIWHKAIFLWDENAQVKGVNKLPTNNLLWKLFLRKGHRALSKAQGTKFWMPWIVTVINLSAQMIILMKRSNSEYEKVSISLLLLSGNGKPDWSARPDLPPQESVKFSPISRPQDRLFRVLCCKTFHSKKNSNKKQPQVLTSVHLILSALKLAGTWLQR